MFCVSRLEEHLERAYLEFPVLVELIELNAQCVAQYPEYLYRIQYTLEYIQFL